VEENKAKEINKKGVKWGRQRESKRQTWIKKDEEETLQ